MSKTSYDEVNKIWSGPKIPPLYNPNQNLGMLILQILKQTPDSVTQISADTGVSVTCRQMYDRTLRIAKYLQKSGLKTGDKVGFVAENGENLAPVVFACMTLGLPVNPLSPIMNERDIIQMYSKTEPKVIFCDAEIVKVVQSSVTEMKSGAKILTVMDKVDGYECVSEILKEMENESVDDFKFQSTDPDSNVLILCTSGSTGSPKGVCKSHRQVIHEFIPYFDLNKNKPTVIFQSSYIFWYSGILFYALGALYKCIRVITTQKIQPETIVEIIQKHHINTLMIGPYAVAKILDIADLKPFESVTYWINAGSILSKDLSMRQEEFIPNGYVCNGYGCSEEGYIAFNMNSSKHGSCGVPVNNIEIRIVDENCKALGPNQQGEIVTRVPIQFSGYFGEQQQTEESFEGEWFKTGDIGYFDDDGYLYVVDRKKELMKYLNYPVAPSEIESVINEIRGIVSSSVIGVYDESIGSDIIHAFVIVEESSDLTENSIAEYVNEKVSDPKRIRGGVHIVDSFPLTFSGKVSKIRLREIAKNDFSIKRE